MNSKSSNRKQRDINKYKYNKSPTNAQNNKRLKKKWYQKTPLIILLLIIFFPVGFFLMLRYTKWNKVVKTVLSVFSGVWFIAFIYALTLPPPEQILLSADTSQVYDVDTNVDIILKTSPEDYSIPKSAFYVSDGKITYNDDKITFTSSSEGKFEIYAKYSGVTSNKITLNFEDKQKKIEEAEQLAREKEEAERIAAEKAETERIAAEKAEAERIAAEKAETERIAAEKAEAERIAAEKAEAERIAAEKAEAERIAAEKAEAERIAAEKAEAERIAQEQATAVQPQNPGNNFNIYDNPEQQQTTSSYVLNTSSMKFHYPSCRDVKKIAQHNYSTYDGTRDDLMGQGYSPCGHCTP